MELSKGRTIVLICALNATVTVGAVNTGMLTVLLPKIDEDLCLSRSLLLWPALVYSLTCGCTLLLFGAIADIVGNRTINLLGTLVFGVFIFAFGFANSGLQLIVFRALQGVGISMCFPTSVSILSKTFPTGRLRNIALGCLGFGTPLGFAIGMLVGGWFGSTSIFWRSGFYLTAAVSVVLLAVNFFCLPQESSKDSMVWSSLKRDIDWIGVLFSSMSMGLISYSLALIAEDPSSLKDPTNILFFILVLATLPLFVLWMHVQEKRRKPALIPNSLWKNSTFSAICLMVLLTWATLQGMEWFLSLFYQEVQHLSPIETAVRYIPNVIAGATLNIFTGLIIHRLAVNNYVVAISAICSISPLLMAVMDIDWPWWYAGFWVNLLLPISVDVNYTVANLLITDIFSKETQALAGAVYQTMSQLGISIGIAVLAVISNTVTDATAPTDKESPEALMEGFRAVFWACFVMMVLSTLIGWWGLRDCKKIGTSNEVDQVTSSYPKEPTVTITEVTQYPNTIERKALSPNSALVTQYELGRRPGYTRMSSYGDTSLPQFPAKSRLAMDLEAGVTPNRTVRWYDGGSRSLTDACGVHEDVPEIV